MSNITTHKFKPRGSTVASVFVDVFNRRFLHLVVVNVLGFLFLGAVLVADERAGVIEFGMLGAYIWAAIAIGRPAELLVLKTLPIPPRHLGTTWWLLALPAAWALPGLCVSIPCITELFSAGHLSDSTAAASLYILLCVIAANVPMANIIYFKRRKHTQRSAPPRNYRRAIVVGVARLIALVFLLYLAIKVVLAVPNLIGIVILFCLSSSLSIITFTNRALIFPVFIGRAAAFQPVETTGKDKRQYSAKRKRLNGFAGEFIPTLVPKLIIVMVLAFAFDVYTWIYPAAVEHIDFMGVPVTSMFLVCPILLAPSSKLRAYRMLPGKSWKLSAWIVGTAIMTVIILLLGYVLGALLGGFEIQTSICALILFWSGLAATGSLVCIFDMANLGFKGAVFVAFHGILVFVPIFIVHFHLHEPLVLFKLAVAGFVLHIVGFVLMLRAITHNSNAYRRRIV